MKACRDDVGLEADWTLLDYVYRWKAGEIKRPRGRGQHVKWERLSGLEAAVST